MKGRASLTNRSGRYERTTLEEIDDGWSNLDKPAPILKTTLLEDTSRSIISSNQSPDLPFEQSINMYRGCEHGCIYCFARPTHSFLGLSPGNDFESHIFYKPKAADLLRHELSDSNYICKPIAIGTNTDPYQPYERQLKLTRGLISICAKHNHPLNITTKSALIERDIDLLGPMAEQGLLTVSISITTLDHKLSRRMEPRATAPTRRLKTISFLERAGIPVEILVAPVIPFLNDQEIEAILATAAANGCTTASYVMLRLPHELKNLFREWLAVHYPEKESRILNRIRDLYGGKIYESTFGARQSGTGNYSRVIAKRFAVASKHHGLNTVNPQLRTDLFRPPRRYSKQMEMFD